MLSLNLYLGYSRKIRAASLNLSSKSSYTKISTLKKTPTATKTQQTKPKQN